VKKKTKWLIAIIAVMLLAILGGVYSFNLNHQAKMTVTSSGLKDGVWEDKYGAKGTQFNKNGIPSYSIPFNIKNAPKDSKSFALVLKDNDAYEVTQGITWVHWVAANITSNELTENASIKEADQFVQGINSWVTLEGGQQDQELSSFYGGMAPPNKPHKYDLHVYALDTLLSLKNGFYLNQMDDEMDGHILAEYTLTGEYAN
jgi:Raf kinase inhibitor-like YbhB/YbcL family protein